MAQPVYFTPEGFINPELVTKYAQEYANQFFPREEIRKKEPGQRSGGSPQNEKPVTSAQLRRFYGDVKNLETRWRNSADKESAFREIMPLIKLLKAKAAYAKERQLVNESFKIWIWNNVDMINTEKDFQAFLLYFEAVVGFCYGNGLKDNN